jgi:uncharacterized cupredoxin-like copper-binding protein
MNIMKSPLVLATLASVFLLGAAPAAFADAVVAVWLIGESTDMNGMGIKLDTPVVKAGAITFKVVNDAMVEPHEMVVVKAPEAGDLPYNAKKRRVVEGKLKSMGEIGDLKPGEAKDLKLKLTPGKYVLICNIAGHYMAGMQAPFTVE